MVNLYNKVLNWLSMYTCDLQNLELFIKELHALPVPCKKAYISRHWQLNVKLSWVISYHLENNAKTAYSSLILLLFAGTSPDQSQVCLAVGHFGQLRQFLTDSLSTDLRCKRRISEQE